MLQISYLRVPQLLLVLYLALVGKVGYFQDRLIGYGTLLYAKLKELVWGIILPAVAYELVFHMLQHFCRLGAAIPAKVKPTVSLIHLICKPFLQAHRR